MSKKEEKQDETRTLIVGANRREESSKAHLAAPSRIAVVTSAHLFTGELMTIERVQRADNPDFVEAILVHYPTGEIGCLCMYAAHRAKWASLQQKKLEYRTKNRVQGFEHDFGARVSVEPVNIVEKYKVEVKMPRKSTKKDNMPENVFNTRNEARNYAKSLGIPQNRAKKDENGTWSVQTA